MARTRRVIVDGRLWLLRLGPAEIMFRRPHKSAWTRYRTNWVLDPELIANIVRGRGARRDTAGETLAQIVGRR